MAIEDFTDGEGAGAAGEGDQGDGGAGVVNANKQEAPGIQLPTDKDGYVKVKAEDLTSIFARLDKQAKDLDLLYRASDKNRLSRALGETEESLVKQVKISVWQDTGAHVIGWKLVKNVSEIVAGRWVEDQQVQVVFEEGEPVVVPLLEFYRKILQKDLADILERTEKSEKINGRVEKFELLSIQFEDGKKLTINSRFVN